MTNDEEGRARAYVLTGEGCIELSRRLERERRERRKRNREELLKRAYEARDAEGE